MGVEVECRVGGSWQGSSAWADPNGAMSHCHFARTTPVPYPPPASLSLYMTLPLMVTTMLGTDEKVLFFAPFKNRQGIYSTNPLDIDQDLSR